MENIKEVLKGYSIIGVVMAAFMLAIKPYVNIRQTIRDTAIVFLFTVFSGMMLENFIMSEYLKLGLSGCFGFWSVEIYKICLSVFSHVEKHPEIVIEKLSRKNHKD